MVCDEVVYLGLFFKPEQPHQMTYGQVWNIVKTNAGIDALREKGYTVPLNSVASAGTGLVTKSLVACGRNYPALPFAMRTAGGFGSHLERRRL